MLSHQVRVIRESLRRFNRRAGVLSADPYGIGLSLSQGSALVDLGRYEKLRPNDLVRLLNLEKSSISRLIAVLERRGFISVRQDQADGRRKWLRLTPSGQKAADTINRISDDSVRGALEVMSLKDRKGVAEAFERLMTSLETKENIVFASEGRVTDGI